MKSNTVKHLNSFRDLPACEWAALNRGDFPFTDLAFFQALETGDCLGRRTGWFTELLVLKNDRGEIRAALPLFLKTNSFGEYIFDWAWANAAERGGIPYYPKFAAAVPFVPATGRKFLIHPDEPAQAARTLLNEHARALAEKRGVSSIHYLFTTEDETLELAQNGFTPRDSFQYHWRNRDWTSFDDFLQSLRSKRRKEIRHEREQVKKLPLRIEALSGERLTKEHAHIMYRFYASTVFKMGGRAYLSEDFFVQLFATLSDRVLLFLAFDDQGRAVAGALNLFEGRSIFGRHWGCHEDFRHLHFELCYYRAIEWAIERGFRLFEAGAQGEHKFTRGFEPSVCRSAHWIAEPHLARAIDDFIEQEREGIRELFAEYKTHDPFKREQPAVTSGATS